MGDPSAAWLATLKNQSIARGLAYARFMYTGGLVAGTILAPVSYVISYAIWAVVARFAPRPVLETGKTGSPSPQSLKP